MLKPSTFWVVAVECKWEQTPFVRITSFATSTPCPRWLFSLHLPAGPTPTYSGSRTHSKDIKCSGMKAKDFLRNQSPYYWHCTSLLYLSGSISDLQCTHWFLMFCLGCEIFSFRVPFVSLFFSMGLDMALSFHCCLLSGMT